MRMMMTMRMYECRVGEELLASSPLGEEDDYDEDDKDDDDKDVRYSVQGVAVASHDSHDDVHNECRQREGLLARYGQ